MNACVAANLAVLGECGGRDDGVGDAIPVTDVLDGVRAERGGA